MSGPETKTVSATAEVKSRPAASIDSLGVSGAGTVLLPRVKPLSVFAAGRERFEFLVRGFCNVHTAKIVAFQDLPLEEYGWDRFDCRFRHIRNVPEGMVYLAERTN